MAKKLANLVAVALVLCLTCGVTMAGRKGMGSQGKTLRCFDSNIGECVIHGGYCVTSITSGYHGGGEPYGNPPPAGFFAPGLEPFGAPLGPEMGFIYRKKREYTGGTGVMGPPAVFVTKGCEPDCREYKVRKGAAADVQCCRGRDFCNASSNLRFQAFVAIASLLVAMAMSSLND